MSARIHFTVEFLVVSFLSLILFQCSGSGDGDVAGTGNGRTAVLPEELPAAEPYETMIEEFDLVAPSGNRIYGMIRRPDDGLYGDLAFAAVVVVPGGINPGRLLARGEEARILAEAGMAVVTFNAEGRADDSPEDSLSEGTEDYNGFRHQDGLAAIVEWVASLEYVMEGNVGIRTQSYGITMAAGAVHRHPDLPVKYIVDGEGPPNSFVTAHEPWSLDTVPANDRCDTVYSILGHYSIYRDPSPENVLFWEEREADRFIGSFRGRCLRLQAEWDHAQPPSCAEEIAVFHQPPLWWQCKHTTEIVNSAVAGGVPWVRVNLEEQGNPVNATYSRFDHPVYLPGELTDRQWAARAVIEMARMEMPGTI